MRPNFLSREIYPMIGFRVLGLSQSQGEILKQTTFCK
jgi:hypothetical protein